MEALRRFVFVRDKFRCQHVLKRDRRGNPTVICGKEVTWETGHLAHIISRGRGGPDHPENTCCKCAECHMIREHHEGGGGKIVPSKGKSLSENMQKVLATIADAKNGEISGTSVATWLGQRRHPEGVRETLRALTNRGLIVMRPMDDPADEFRQRYPDRLKAMYSVWREPTEDTEGTHFIGTHERH